jgi:hypothetical protein
LIWIFGLLIGVAWMAVVLFGNLRTYHLQAYRAIGWIFVGSAVAFTALAGLIAAYRTGGFCKRVLASLCSRLVSGIIVLTGATAMEVVFHNALRQSPSVLADFAQSGQTDLSSFIARLIYRIRFTTAAIS